MKFNTLLNNIITLSAIIYIFSAHANSALDSTFADNNISQLKYSLISIIKNHHHSILKESSQFDIEKIMLSYEDKDETDNITVGDILNYKIILIHDISEGINNLRFVDELKYGMTLIGKPSVSNNIAINDMSNDKLVDLRFQGNLSPGKYEIAFKAMLNDPSASQVCNQGKFTSSEYKRETNKVCTDVVIRQESLAAIKTASHRSSPLRTGDAISYAITLKNDGIANANGVRFIDKLDPRTTFKPETFRPRGKDYTLENNELIVHVNTLKEEETLDISFDVEVNAGPFEETQICNQGKVTSSTSTDEVMTNEVCTDVVIGQESLAATKAASHRNNPLRTGDAISYIITLKNDGVADANGVRFIDKLDPRTTFKPETFKPRGKDYTLENNELIVHVNTLESKKTLEISFDVEVNDDLFEEARICNQGKVTSSTSTDEVMTNEVCVMATPRTLVLSAKMTDLPVDNPVMPGSRLPYQVNLRNDGNVDIRDINFSLTPAPPTVLISGTVIVGTKGCDDVMSSSDSDNTGIDIRRGNRPGDTEIDIDINRIEVGEEMVICFNLVIQAIIDFDSNNFAHGKIVDFVNVKTNFIVENYGVITIDDYRIITTEDPEPIDDDMYTTKTRVDGQLGEILVTGRNPQLGAVNAAIIFDSSTPTEPTDEDRDLGTPNMKCPIDGEGPGEGTDVGPNTPYENCTQLLNLLIVADNLQDMDDNDHVDTPNDFFASDDLPATIELNFMNLGELTVQELTVIDFDEQDEPSVEFFNSLGESLDIILLPNDMPNNGVKAIDFGGQQNVEKMRITLEGAGAVDNIKFFLPHD